MLLPCQQCLRANFFRITRCTGKSPHNDRNYFTDPADNLLAKPWRKLWRRGRGEKPQTLKLHCAPGTKVGAHHHACRIWAKWSFRTVVVGSFIILLSRIVMARIVENANSNG